MQKILRNPKISKQKYKICTARALVNPTHPIIQQLDAELGDTITTDNCRQCRSELDKISHNGKNPKTHLNQPRAFRRIKDSHSFVPTIFKHYPANNTKSCPQIQTLSKGGKIPSTTTSRLSPPIWLCRLSKPAKSW